MTDDEDSGGGDDGDSPADGGVGNGGHEAGDGNSGSGISGDGKVNDNSVSGEGLFACIAVLAEIQGQGKRIVIDLRTA